MLKKIMMASVFGGAAMVAIVVLLGFGGTDSVAGSKEKDTRPQEIILKTANIPTNFNHEQHQELFECSECHHSKKSDGSKGPYIDGDQPACNTCHNEKDMASSVVRGDVKLNSYEGAAHTTCIGCHYKILRTGEKAGPTKKGNGKCVGCHPYKKQYCPVRKWL